MNPEYPLGQQVVSIVVVDVGGDVGTSVGLAVGLEVLLPVGFAVTQVER